MKHSTKLFFLVVLWGMANIKVLADVYQLAIKNEDGVMIYYNYVNGGLEVTAKAYGSVPRFHYWGNVVIPDYVEVSPGVKKAVVSIGRSAFEHCQQLTSVTIPSTVTTIKSFAFSDCTQLTDMTILGKITLSGDRPISCKSLKNVYISDLSDWLGITCAEDYADYDNSNSLFYNTKTLYLNGEKITDLVIPENVSNIRDYAFYGCESIKSLIIPDGVTSIGNQAFYGCNSIESLTLPSSVTSIGDNAFRSSLIKSVVVKGESPAQWGGNYVFNLKTINHGVLYVPTNTWETYAFGNSWYTFINIREMTTSTEDLSAMKAYTLVNTADFKYMVYDPINNELRADVSVNGIDENNPCHSWQTVERNGQTFLYNIGAKKFVVPSDDGLALTDEISSIAVEETENGVVFAGKRNTQWGFVGNENLMVSKDLNNVIASIPNVSSPRPSKIEYAYYNLNGQIIAAPQRGVNILKMNDGQVKKVLAK